jgi:hypothetical protein
MKTIRTCGHTATECTAAPHIHRAGYRSAHAADKYAATEPAPAGRIYVVRDNHEDPGKATALDIWCVPQ